MTGSEAHVELDLLHPAVALAYCGMSLVLAMCAMHPVYLLLCLLGALAWRVCLMGARSALAPLAWQLPLALVVAVANAVFVSSGSTVVLRVGVRAFYLEALLYGLCQGLMLVDVLTCFANASEVLTADKVMALLGGSMPTVALMLSMTMRLVPRFSRRASQVQDAARACTAAGGTTEPGAGRGTRRRARRCLLDQRLRLSTVLLGWGLEDSLETADSMRARGWGAAPVRTSYRRQRFRATDALALALVALLSVASALSAWAACVSFSFYPQAQGLAPWFSYAPYVAFLLLPLALHLKEVHTWRWQ